MYTCIYSSEGKRWVGKTSKMMATAMYITMPSLGSTSQKAFINPVTLFTVACCSLSRSA
jgi:hypothetical protein